MVSKLVLGIETSCDDTSVCLLRQSNTDSTPEVLSHLSYSQIKELAEWGGVVPEIAARSHLEKITPLLKSCFDDAKVSPKDVDHIGVTTHPGLLGPLLTGLNAAKTLALTHKTSILPVNHLYAHLEAIHLSEKVHYPYLGLLVSGGHSLYMLVKSASEFEILGSTIDDAAGEAFDKGGKLLGLGYPAGRVIDDLSKEANGEEKFEFPIGLKNSKDCYLSFSGVKSTLRDLLKKNEFDFDSHPETLKNICASYQHAIVEALSLKLKFAREIAANKLNIPTSQLPIVVGGGVACNSALRSIIKENFENSFFVKPVFCTDNGAMIANYALRNFGQAISFPKCLDLDARGRFIDKKAFKDLVSDNKKKSKALNNEQ